MVALVDGVRAWAAPGARGRCPDCHAEVRAKCGPIVCWHWAHEPDAGCPFEHEPETEWHRAWKRRFPIGQVERRLAGRRADVLLPDGAVLEFQHSSIPVDEIRRREHATPRMTWIFNVRGAVGDDRLDLRDRGAYWSFRWKHPRKTVAVCRKPVLLDLGPGPVGVAPLLRLGRIYPDAPCGGYGRLVHPDELWPNHEETSAA